MHVIHTDLPGVLIIEPRVFLDPRGFFKETYQKERYRSAGIDCEFVQDNVSSSCRGTVRGLHYQLRRAQAKLVQVLLGEVFDVAVDLRRGSPTFGRWTGTVLSGENHRQLFVPPGFAHGFCVTSPQADIFYKCSDYYFPEHERTLLWNDPQVKISWPLSADPVLSDKDRRGTPLCDIEAYPPVES